MPLISGWGGACGRWKMNIAPTHAVSLACRRAEDSEDKHQRKRGGGGTDGVYVLRMYPDALDTVRMCTFELLWEWWRVQNEAATSTTPKKITSVPGPIVL